MHSIIFWSLFVVTANGFFSKATDIVQTLNLTGLCPSTNFCTHRASSNFSNTKKRPCCSSCLCTNDCHMYGNCCLDVKHQVHHKSSRPECYFPVYNIDSDTKDFYNNYIFTGINSYNTFVKCPEKYKNYTVRNMCEGIPNRLEDLALVSNEKGYVYKNKHCAHCHGIEKILSWSLKMKCLSSENAENFLNALPIVKNDTCMIWSFPQKADIGRRSLCFKAHDTCDMHGSLRNACLSYTLYYFHNFRGLIFLFKNVHCFACTHSKHLLKGLCDLMITAVETPKLPSTLLPITAFLDVDPLADVTQPNKVSKAKTCSKSEIYDSYFNYCRILECPVISSAMYGKCVSYYNNIFGFSVSILVDFQAVSKKSEFEAVKTSFDQSEQSKYYRFYTTIVTAFINSTKQSMKECGVCETYFLDNGTLTCFYVLFHTNSRCTVNDLYSNLYTYAQRSHQFNVIIERKLFAFMTRVRLIKRAPVPEMFTKFRLKSAICDNPILFNGDLTCPKVTLNQTEYRMLRKKGVYHGKVLEREIPHFPKNIERNNEVKTVSTRNKNMKMAQEFAVCWNEYNKFINTGSTISKLDWFRIICASLNWLLILLSPIQ